MSRMLQHPAPVTGWVSLILLLLAPLLVLATLSVVLARRAAIVAHYWIWPSAKVLYAHLR